MSAVGELVENFCTASVQVVQATSTLLAGHEEMRQALKQAGEEIISLR